MPPTLILTPRYTDDSQRLWRAAGSLGWNVERLIGWRVPEELKVVEEPVLYVEAMFAQVIGDSFGFSFVELPDDWLTTVPTEYLNRDVKYTTIGEVKKDLPRFVKPPNDKSFKAQVCNDPEDLPVLFPDDYQVISAEPVEWECEYRFFVSDRKAVTQSVYMVDGEFQKHLDFPVYVAHVADAIRFASKVLDDTRVWLPDEIVLDVGRIKNRGWSIIEINAVWGSGIYGCDPIQVLHVLQKHMKGRKHGAHLH